MEPMLRAWAERRSQQAGPPFELHPVDRHRLQEEVLRAQIQPTKSSLANPIFWRGLIPRLAVIGVLTTLAVVALVQWNQDATPPNGEMKLAAKVGDQPDSIAAPEAAPAVSTEADTSTAAYSRVSTTAEAPTSESSPGSVPRPARQPASASSVADRLALDAEVPAPISPRRRETLTPLASDVVETARPYPANLAPPTWSASFSQQMAPRRNFNAPPNYALTSFELEKRGNRIRLVDQDGSVYEGNIITIATNLTQGLTTTRFGADESPDATVGLNFQVSGTNRSQQKGLVLKGVLVTGRTHRVQGRALVGERDRIIVDAIGNSAEK